MLKHIHLKFKDSCHPLSPVFYCNSTYKFCLIPYFKPHIHGLYSESFLSHKQTPIQPFFCVVQHFKNVVVPPITLAGGAKINQREKWVETVNVQTSISVLLFKPAFPSHVTHLKAHGVNIITFLELYAQYHSCKHLNRAETWLQFAISHCDVVRHRMNALLAWQVYLKKIIVSLFVTISVLLAVIATFGLYTRWIESRALVVSWLKN